jgi:hypothetical protein
MKRSWPSFHLAVGAGLTGIAVMMDRDLPLSTVPPVESVKKHRFQRKLSAAVGDIPRESGKFPQCARC